MHPREWFGAWLKDHKALNPHKLWTSYEEPGYGRMYKTWVRMFRVRGITREIAVEASERMTAGPEVWPNRQLAQILKLSAGIQAEIQARHREEDRQQSRRDQAVEDRYETASRTLWAEIPETAREDYRRKVRQAVPGLEHQTKFIEALARKTWAEEARPILLATLGP